MMHKNILIFGFFILSSIAFYAQKDKIEYLPTFDKKRIHYGFYLGLNNNDYKLSFTDEINNTGIDDANITVNATAGFNVGLIGDLRLHENLNLRFEPGLMTNSKTINYSHLEGADATREVNSTFLHLPLLLKFSTDRHKNIRPYVLGGLSYDFNFSSAEDGDDNSQGQFRTTSSNFMYEVGVGIDIYLYFFKFSPSIRGVFAINNELVNDNDPNSQWTAPINQLNTRGVFISLAFE